MAGRNRSGLKKVVKTVKSKKGTARRTYWVKANPKAKSGRLRQGGQPQQPGFVRRHAGKILAGAALAGALAYGNRGALKGALDFAKRGHQHIRQSGQQVRAIDHARGVFQMARLGLRSGHLEDRRRTLAAAQGGSRLAQARLQYTGAGKGARARAALGRGAARAGEFARSDAARGFGGALLSMGAGAAGASLLGPMGGTVASMAADHFGGHLMRGAGSLAGYAMRRFRR